MKMYLNEQQTAKLIELGLPKPISVTRIIWSEDEKDSPIINANTIEYTRHYSIGELLSFLPLSLGDDDYNTLTIRGSKVMYCDPYFDWIEAEWVKYEELIDNLFDACVELKQEGII